MKLVNYGNLPNLTKMLSFYTKHLKRSLKCSQCRFKAFQNEIKCQILNFDMTKGFLILKELGKNIGSKIRQIRQICQLSLNHRKTQLPT